MNSLPQKHKVRLRGLNADYVSPPPYEEEGRGGDFVFDVY